MYCPHCSGIRLVMTERQGIEIDYCPQCRGVWLDRGELDKLIEKSVAVTQSLPNQSAPAYQPPPQQVPQYQQPQYQQQPYQQPQYQQSHYKHKRPKSFWEEIFD